MKKVLFFSCILALAFATNCQSKTPQDDPEEASKDQVTAYFINYLSGKNTQFTGAEEIEVQDIAQYQTTVWQAWVKAHENVDEEALMPLDLLRNKKPGSWQLPAHLEENATLPYYWGSKGNNKPQQGYPLFLYLHGSGPKAHEWEAGFQLSQQFNDGPSVYFIPQIPREDRYRWWQQSKQYAWEKLLRLSFITGHINPNRVYFFGISEGGYGSQRLASFYADYLAGAAPMAGGEPLKNAPAVNCSNMAFALFTGQEDNGFYRNILTGYVKEEFDNLSQTYPQLFRHRVELIPGRGHQIDYSVATPWLKQFVRNPYPTHFIWEDYPMDERYRKGFYNIEVTQRTAERTQYHVQIAENVVTLQVDEVAYTTTQTDPVYGIEMKFQKQYTPAAHGSCLLYLHSKLVDLNQEVTVVLNGKQAFKGKVKPNLKHLVRSCATFFDPERLYPAAVEITW